MAHTPTLNCSDRRGLKILMSVLQCLGFGLGLIPGVMKFRGVRYSKHANISGSNLRVLFSGIPIYAFPASVDKPIGPKFSGQLDGTLDYKSGSVIMSPSARIFLSELRVGLRVQDCFSTLQGTHLLSTAKHRAPGAGAAYPACP